MNKNKNRKNCFLCKYELTKHNRSTKFVKYNKNLKPICKYCTKHKHKALQYKNSEIDTQCKICKNPTLYKKCIACSICEHLYHGKCVDLNKDDIEKIESTYNFFICQQCNNSILPQQSDADQVKPKKALRINADIKNCLTCNKQISKKLYENKYFIYNNKKYVSVKTVVWLGNTCA